MISYKYTPNALIQGSKALISTHQLHRRPLRSLHPPQVMIDLGLGSAVAGDPGARGAGDISDIAQYIDCLDGLGASGTGAHKAGETINLREYPWLIKRAALLLARLAD